MAGRARARRAHGRRRGRRARAQPGGAQSDKLLADPLFPDGGRRGEKGTRAAPEWTATVLLWVRADAGVARVLVDGLGVEAVVRLARPTRLGESVSLSFSGADDRGGPSFAQVGGAVVTDDEEEEEDEEGEAGEDEE